MQTVLRGEIVAPGHSSGEDRRRRAWMAQQGYLAGYTGNTYATHKTDLAGWVEWLDRWGVDYFDVSRSHIELYMRELDERGLAAGTRAKKMSVIAGAYQWAEDEDLIVKSPARRVRRPKVPDEMAGLGLSRTEMYDFLITAETRGPRDLALACLGGLNGLRASEMCGINVEAVQVVLGHRTIPIKGKGGKVARVALAPITSRSVEQTIGDRARGPLFVDRKGRRLTRNQLWWIVQHIAKAAGIRHHVTTHDLRRAFVTNGLKAGIDLREMQVAARHTDPRVTADYDRAIRSLDASPTFAIAAFIAGAA